MSVLRPKEYRPELANAEKPQSREAKLRESMGLSKDPSDIAGSDEEDSLPPAIPARKGTTISSNSVNSFADQKHGGPLRPKEAEDENAELKKKMNEQIETIKKLASSKVSNTIKSYEEKLTQKDKEMEELQLARQSDTEQLAILTGRIKGLESQILSLGGRPVPQPATEIADIDSRLAQELDRLRRDNAVLRQEMSVLRRTASDSGSGTGSTADARFLKLEGENREMKKTIDNLMEVNSKLVDSTKSKIALLEQELSHHKARRHGSDADSPSSRAAAAAAGESEAMKQLQAVLKEESEARGKADKEITNLRQQLATASQVAKPQGVPHEEVKKLQVEIREKEKQIGQLTHSLKAVKEDASIKEKELNQKAQGLQTELERVGREGSAKIQDTKTRIRKCVRKIHQDLQALRKAHGDAKQGVGELRAELLPAMKAFYQPLKKAVTRIQRESSGWVDKYKKEADERKRLHNLVLELKGNIRVFCRIRPRLPHEGEASPDTAVAVLFPEDRPELEDNCIAVVDDAKGSDKTFEFDHTFGPASTQEEVFLEVEALVTSVLDGYNVCIFAYGQTGSGKTYTMEGTVLDRGINPRTLARVFDQIAERDQFSYWVELSILEIYNEEIHDLLDPKSSKKLEVRQGPDGIFVQDLTREQVSSFEQTNRIWADARSNRTTFSNNVNEYSSRSHLVISVYVRGENRATGAGSYGKLHLVDLAGSERLSRTNATGDRLKEAQSINKSLSALGDVIAAAAAKQGHVPYRNSKLTHVLQDSLGQDSKTLMIVQASPLAKDVGESLCSLQFAIRARSVELGPARRHTAKPTGAAAGAAKR